MCSLTRRRKSSGHLPRHALRLGDDLRRRHRDVLGITAKKIEAGDLIVDPEVADLSADLRHHAGELVTENLRELDLRTRWGPTRTNRGISGLHPRGDHPHQHLPGLAGPDDSCLEPGEHQVHRTRRLRLRASM